MSLSLLVAVALSQSNPQLPADHPAMGSSPGAPASSDQLPPGHPPLDQLQGMRAPLLPPGSPAQGPSAEDSVRTLDQTKDSKTREKGFEVAAAVGKLYYGQARYADAAEYLGQAWAKSEPARAAAKKLSPAPGTPCAQPTLGLAELLARRSDAKLLAACLPQGVEASLEVGEMRANALFLAGDLQGAISALNALLEAAPARGEALFSRGAVRLEGWGDDPAELKKAKADFDRLLKVAPGSPRAAGAKALSARADLLIAAGGAKKLAQREAAERRAHPAGAPGGEVQPAGGQSGDIAPVSPEAMEAVKNTERTPELKQGLAKLVEEGEAHLAKREYDEALGDYTRVVPFEPENGRAKAGMAWAMVGLKKPAAERVWEVAVSSDPAAVDALGKMLQAAGAGADAKELWKKLAQSAPGYAKQTGLPERLK